MAEKTFELEFLNTARAGERVPLPAGELFIGRSRTNAISLEDPLVSRKHVRIATTRDSVVAEDLDSSHGTFLNDKRTRGSVSLSHGDVLQLGDAKLRFVLTAHQDDEACTAFVDEVAATVSPSRATGCAQVSSGGETRFMPPENISDDGEFENTRVIGNGETRMMDEAEFKGLRASPRQPLSRKMLLPLILLAVVTAIIVVAWMLTREGGGIGESGKVVSHTDERYAMHLAAPADWKLKEGNNGAVFGFELKIRGSETTARVDVYADHAQDYTTTGIQMAFEDYLDIITARLPGVKIQGSKLMIVNSVTAIFYAFSSPQRAGKGLFLLSGNKRICAECTCQPGCTDLLETVFPAILRSFRLNEPQQFIDFPPPTKAIRLIALANKDHLVAMSRRDLDVGIELLKHREVRPENLFLATHAFQACLTTASALGTRPPFYSEAAGKLAAATVALHDTLRDQKFRIIMSEQKRDTESAYWESLKLAQIMPEKTSEAYQFASKRINFYSQRRQE